MDNSEDILDVREIIERFEELETSLEASHEATNEEISGNIDFADWLETISDVSEEYEEVQEYKTLKALLDEMKGYGGDHQWRGDWYPVTLINDSHFEDYARELAEETGAVNSDATWPNNCIDWEKAATELQADYSTVEFDGVTYWYR